MSMVMLLYKPCSLWIQLRDLFQLAIRHILSLHSLDNILHTLATRGKRNRWRMKVRNTLFNFISILYKYNKMIINMQCIILETRFTDYVNTYDIVKYEQICTVQFVHILRLSILAAHISLQMIRGTGPESAVVYNYRFSYNEE